MRKKQLEKSSQELKKNHNMKHLKKFNEAEEYIHGNPAFPEGYLEDALRRRQLQIQQQGEGSFNISKAQRLIAGKERELEELLTKTMNKLYSGLVERYNITFDIKFANNREIRTLLTESFEEEKHKRKIANLITQGEAKNMMHVIHSPEITEGVIEIFGEEKGRELIEIWSNIVKAVDIIDMNRDINHFDMSFITSTVMGVVKIGWTPNDETNEEQPNINSEIEQNIETPEDEEDNSYEETEQIINSNEDDYGEDDYDEDEYDDEESEESDEDDWNQRLLNALNTGNEEVVDDIVEEEDLPTDYVNRNFTPKIIVRGADFTLLIHECIKGIYNVLSLAGVPKDRDMARRLIGDLEQSLREEPEEFKWGPIVAADLRDFLNEYPDVDKYPNMREEFWRELLKLPTNEFFPIVNAILSKSEEGKIKSRVIFKRVIKGIEKKIGKKMKAEYEKRLREHEEEMRLWQERQRQNQPVRQEAPITQEEPQEETEIDYSNMSQKQLNDLQNQAIDDGDYVTATKIAQYIR